MAGRVLLEDLTVTLSTDTKKLQDGLRLGQKEVGNFRSAMERTDFRAFKVGAVAVVAGLAVMARGAQQAVKEMDAIADAAAVAGLTASAFQELEFVLGQNGVAANEFASASRRLHSELGKAAEGEAKQAKLFSDLGLAVRDSSGHVRTADQIWSELPDALSRIEDPAIRAAKASELLGRENGVKMATALNMSSDAMNRARAEAVELGAVWSNETVARAADLNDQFEAQSTIIKKNLSSAFAELMPLVVSGAQGMAELARFTAEASHELAVLAGLTERTEREDMLVKAGELAQIEARMRDLGKARGFQADRGWDTTRVDSQLQELRGQKMALDAQIAAYNKQLQYRVTAPTSPEATTPVVKPSESDERAAKALAQRRALLSEEQAHRARVLEAQEAGNVELLEQLEIEERIADLRRSDATPQQIEAEIGLLRERNRQLAETASAEERIAARVKEAEERQALRAAAIDSASKVEQDAIQDMRDSNRAFAQEFSSMLGRMVGESETSFSDIGREFAQMIKAITIQTLVTKPFQTGLEGFLNGATSGKAGDSGSSAFGAAVGQGVRSLFGFAEGGRPPINQDVIVGENGPERVRIMKPAMIEPNGYKGGGQQMPNVVNNVDARPIITVVTEPGMRVTETRRRDEQGKEEIRLMVSAAMQDDAVRRGRGQASIQTVSGSRRTPRPGIS